MTLRKLWVLVALLGAAAAVGPWGAAGAAQEALVPQPSRYLDQFWVQPKADFAAYRSVLVDPARVSFYRNWLKDMNQARFGTRRVTQEEVDRIAHDAAASLQGILVDAFRRHGYSIAATAGPGVLRISPRIEDLYVNAPERDSPWPSRTFTREAGDAVLVMEIRDSASGALLGRVRHHGVADQMRRIERSNDARTRFWFDALFTRWAADCVTELQARSHRAHAAAEPQTGR
jgi:hypothetical protein